MTNNHFGLRYPDHSGMPIYGRPTNLKPKSAEKW